MTLPPDTLRAGFTLFEVLVALAILSLMSAVVLAARPVPSPELRLKAVAGELVQSATATRHRAVSTGVDTLWDPPAQDCRGEAVRITLYADGTSDAGDICLTIEGRNLVLEFNVLAGRLETRVP